MHAVARSPEPAFVAGLKQTRSHWDHLDGSERRRIREVLRMDFEECCAYCENWCVEGAVESDNRGTIDHFRPRSRFPGEWLTWLNLVYACRRCNDTKGNLWPELSDITNLRLSVIDRYVGAATYVNPSLIPKQRPASEFFEYRFNSGQMVAAGHLAASEWSKAVRTIADLDLNSDYEAVGERLPYLRRERLDFIIERLGNPMEDVGRTVAILRELTQPNQPFSGFILTYATERFSLLREFLG